MPLHDIKGRRSTHPLIDICKTSCRCPVWSKTARSGRAEQQTETGEVYMYWCPNVRLEVCSAEAEHS